MVEVVSGLTAGDKVIVEGQMKTGEGATVNIVAEKSLQDIVDEDAGYSIPRKQESLKKDFDIQPTPTEPAKEDGSAK